jgi:hypothetical protein
MDVGSGWAISRAGLEIREAAQTVKMNGYSNDGALFAL